MCTDMADYLMFCCRNYILQEDIEYFMPPHKAAKAFEILDHDQDGRVSLHDIRDAILLIYKVQSSGIDKQHVAMLSEQSAKNTKD